MTSFLLRLYEDASVQLGHLSLGYGGLCSCPVHTSSSSPRVASLPSKVVSPVRSGSTLSPTPGLLVFSQTATHRMLLDDLVGFEASGFNHILALGVFAFLHLPCSFPPGFGISVLTGKPLGLWPTCSPPPAPSSCCLGLAVLLCGASDGRGSGSKSSLR